MTAASIARVQLASREDVAAALEHLAGPPEWLAFGEVFEFLGWEEAIDGGVIAGIQTDQARRDVVCDPLHRGLDTLP